MDMRTATKKLDSVQAGKQAIPAKLCGVPVNLIPTEGNCFKILLSMANQNAMTAARRLNDVGADIKPWPPEGHCEAECTWDTTLNYLVMTDELVISR